VIGLEVEFVVFVFVVFDVVNAGEEEEEAGIEDVGEDGDIEFLEGSIFVEHLRRK
jgi:hypothetical protein